MSQSDRRAEQIAIYCSAASQRVTAITGHSASLINNRLGVDTGDNAIRHPSDIGILDCVASNVLDHASGGSNGGASVGTRGATRSVGAGAIHEQYVSSDW